MNIKTIKVKAEKLSYSTLVEMHIKTEESIQDLLIADDVIESGEHEIEGGTLYYKVHATGLVQYGLNGHDQWWSSNLECIHGYFNVKFHYAVVNNLSIAITDELYQGLCYQRGIILMATDPETCSKEEQEELEFIVNELWLDYDIDVVGNYADKLNNAN